MPTACFLGGWSTGPAFKLLQEELAIHGDQSDTEPMNTTTTQSYFERRATKTGWTIQDERPAKPTSWEYDFARWAHERTGTTMTVHYEGEANPQRVTITSYDRPGGWTTGEVNAWGALMLATVEAIDSIGVYAS